ncbi:MAG TPA: ABC transporter ATP-binding protein [Xanthobacteraceae bacterium]|jgi:branched-chain amino acid transport system ATP-binding protein
MLEVKNLRAAYDGKEALRGLTFEVGRGDCVCLLGANGAGKTTTMRCVSGLLAPAAGEIGFNGRNISAMGTAQRVAAGIALVPEGRRVFAPMTVRENLEMGAFRRLWPRRQEAVTADFDFVFELFPRLRERGTQLAGALSGGEQQMLAIARALMSRPKLLLLDEPSMGLAPMVLRDIFATLRQLSASGVSILIAEQNTRMALRLARYAYIIADGVIVKQAAAETLGNDPAIQNAYLGN